MWWEKGKEWISSPAKDFILGQQIFSKIIEQNPKDYWATLLNGGCLSWGGKAKEGEPFIRKALILDPTLPHAYSTLAQNLLLQKRMSEVIDIVEKMLQQTFSSISNNEHDPVEKLVEALSCAKNALNNGKAPKWQNLLKTAIVKYPNTKSKLEAI